MWPHPLRPHRAHGGAILASLVVHVILGLLLWPHLSHRPAPPALVTVDLRPSAAPATPGPPLPGTASTELPPGATGAGRTVARTAAPSSPRPPAVPIAPEGGVSLQAPPPQAAAVPPTRIGGALSEWWSTRSPAAYVEACRQGAAPEDSLLNRIRTPKQAALERNTTVLNEFSLRLHGEWMAEKFREVYAENFPAMH